MARAGVLIGGVIALIGAILGLFYGWDLLTSVNLFKFFDPKTAWALLVAIASFVAFIWSLLLLFDKWALLNALLVLGWGILLLLVFGGGFLSFLAAILMIIGGFIGLIAAIVS
ncbi:MAG: hypothetical protein ACUVXA_18620 [Candidatus Jordarchaeum sp.]|uniref:hypothetical protein n=1 Tax=Candidatus Jordarchaeum sp. TaxID=2823881 RepID=UPI00404AF78E